MVGHSDLSLVSIAPSHGRARLKDARSDLCVSQWPGAMLIFWNNHSDQGVGAPESSMAGIAYSSVCLWTVVHNTMQCVQLVQESGFKKSSNMFRDTWPQPGLSGTSKKRYQVDF